MKQNKDVHLYCYLMRITHLLPLIPGCFRYRGITGGFLLLRIFSVAISESSYLFYLSLILISVFLR